MGGTIEDMEGNIKLIFKREPDYITIYVRTNNATNLTARDILEKLLLLKSTILDARKSCNVIISQSTLYVLATGKLLWLTITFAAY